jgi:hypothetical protein
MPIISPPAMYNPEHPLKHLAEYESTPAPRALTSAAILFLAAATFVVSMPLGWHHRFIEGDGYVLLYGFQGASWLNVIAAIAVIFAIRLVRIAPGMYTKWLLTITAFVAFVGMAADYFDSLSRAAQVFADAYFGPGFYVGLAGMGLVLCATVLTWRTPS